MNKFKLKNYVKDQINYEKMIENKISEIVQKYYKMGSPFKDIVDSLDKEFKEFFAKIPYTYHGLKTELGMLDDLVILYKQKEK